MRYDLNSLARHVINFALLHHGKKIGLFDRLQKPNF